MKPLLHFVIKRCWIFLLPIALQAQPTTPFIVIDEFGYLPNSKKTAVIRNPVTGFDNVQSFPAPGSVYQVVDAQTNQPVFEGSPVQFNNGATDAASGDRLWWFDFSPVSTPGRYYILDVQNSRKSYSFAINEKVYDEVLKHAVRMLFYQRAGCEKAAQYAGVGWADGASHVGPLQDKNCRLKSSPNDATTERDLHGGWYDAGDFNKYTSPTAGYVESLLLAYLEKPDSWTDDYNIPESGNGIPDVLDEAKWGMDYLLRLQEADGSVISYVALASASPPSAATGQSLYDPATTSSTVAVAKTYALGCKVFSRIGMTNYADILRQAALKSWEWANNNQNAGSNWSDLLESRVTTALYLYEITGDKQYLDYFENNYSGMTLFQWGNWMGQYWTSEYFLYFHYLTLDGIDQTIKTQIINALKNGFFRSDDFLQELGTDGYRSFIKDYNWGSNQYKSTYGMIFYTSAEHSLFPANDGLYMDAAEDYLHYIHGVNPFGWVYLTNMNSYGATTSLTEIFHTWFAEGSPKWSTVGVSTYGPAPGYLSGGPNQSYTWDGCCDNKGCGSTQNNALCYSEVIPVNQPPAKMYKDFNTGWPLNSWEITEPSCGYQVAYIRLLSKFVNRNQSNAIKEINVSREPAPVIFPNPSKETVNIRFMQEPLKKWELFDMQMRLLAKQQVSGHSAQVDVSAFPKSVYFLRITTERKSYMQKVIVQ